MGRWLCWSRWRRCWGFRTGTGLAVTAGTDYAVTVGAGGAGSSAAGTRGTNGVNSTFSTITSAGGGGGGGYDGTQITATGKDGGSGGGGGAYGTSPTPMVLVAQEILQAFLRLKATTAEPQIQIFKPTR